MTKPVPDKAEVAVEYPDKLYIGTFEHTSRFDAHLDENGISLSLHRGGPADTRKSVRMHFHYALFAEILRDLARTVTSLPPADFAHREALRGCCAGAVSRARHLLRHGGRGPSLRSHARRGSTASAHHGIDRTGPLRSLQACVRNMTSGPEWHARAPRAAGNFREQRFLNSGSIWWSAGAEPPASADP